MNSAIRYYVGRFVYLGILLGVILSVVTLANSFQIFKASLLGYGISFLFVGSNFYVVSRIKVEDQKKFFSIFFWSVSLRFVLVLGTIIGVLLWTTIDRIFFTVSFIISYILYSVIEIIFINKILETEKQK